MTTDTASLPEQIKKLRENTGAGMMDCKKALTEAGGDFEKAVTALRMKGLSDAAKKSARTTKEGLVAAYLAQDGKTGGIVELNCETDFVAKTEEFQKLAVDLARRAAEGALASPADAGEAVKGLVAKLGENMSLKRFDRFELSGPGRLAFYVHTAGGKKGAMVELSCGSDEAAGHEAVSELARELGMQIVAMSPRWVRKEDVPAAEVDKEREIFETQVRKEGKPEAAVPKIVEGKLRKLFYQAFCLGEQMSMRDNKTPLRKIVEDAAKASGGAIEIARFVRYQLGGE
ncbi:MAG: translation elongation factor Ts [Elusimicrobiota bacterium]